MGGSDRLPLPTLTVSRVSSPATGSTTSLHFAQSPNDSLKLGGGFPIRKIGLKHTSIEETLHRRSGLRETMQSRSSPSLSLSERPVSSKTVSDSSQRQPEMSEVPRTMTPTPLHVRLGGFERRDPWASVLCGKQSIHFPAHAAQGSTDENVSWYNRRELENRCSLPSAEARKKDSSSVDSPTSLGWNLQGATPKTPIRTPLMGRATPGGMLGTSLATSPTRKKLPLALSPKIEDSGWSHVNEASIWAEQARALASWRVKLTTPPSSDRDHALQHRLKLLDFLERHEVPKGVEALRAGFCFRFGDLEQAFKYLDIAGNGHGPSMLEMSGSLALLGFDARSFCGCSDVELFVKLDVDCDGRIGLQDLLGVSTAPSARRCSTHSTSMSFKNTHKLVRGASTSASIIKDIAVDMDTWSNDEEAVLDPDGRDRWALLVKFVALSAWFATPAKIRQRGRPEKKELRCGRTCRHQPATPVVRAPGRGDIGHGRASGVGELSLLKFEKVNGSVVPDGWRLATHKEVMACKSDVLLLMSDWDVCGLADGWRFDGAAYGHNLKEPHGKVEFGMILVCREEVHNSQPPPSENTSPLDTSTSVILPSQDSQHVSGETGGELAKQQALDTFRSCWMPNEGELEDTKRVLQLHFMARASVRQFGEPLLSRKDVDHLLGRLPPPGLEEAPFAHTSPPVHRTPSHAEVRRIYDQVLDMQVVLSSLKGKALSKGLTFESFRVFLQRLSLALDLHFRHLVDDAFEAHAESAGFVV